MLPWMGLVLLSTVQASSVSHLEVIGQDVSSEYQQIANELDQNLNAESFADLSQYKILLVRGFFSDQMPAPKSLYAIARNPSLTFSDQAKWFRKQSIEFSILPTHSEQIPEVNAPILLDAIRHSSKPIIFMSHSRGGLDVLEAMLTGEEALLSKVKGWIALQGPFQGTPLADEFLINPLIRLLTGKILQLIGGSISSVFNMSLPQRKNYNESRAEKIERLRQSLPILCLSTWKPNISGYDTEFEITRDLMDYLGFQTDGVIPWQSEILPGSDYVFIKNLDHPSTVHENSIVSFDRTRMTKTLFKMLRNRM
ncbi:MAG: putative exported protein [Bacteriovoracaceae bacterium]|nr:putative exported protein [Bacteriovoracaceae bacterium]